MTRRKDLQHYRHSLSEIRNILNAMKTLAYMETRKLSTFLDSQHRVVEGITEVAADFLNFYPDTLPIETDSTPVYLLIGTQRGFCGDFNQAVVRHVDSILTIPSNNSPHLIVIGHKLYNLLPEETSFYARIDGASVVEEVSGILDQIVQALVELQATHPMLSLYSVYHSEEEGIVTEKLLPPFQNEQPEISDFLDPPMINIPPKEFILDVSEQYLFAALHELLYTSLLEENRRRMVHLEGAIKHLDDLSNELTQQFNVLRREEIIEEIEVILLNTGSLDDF
ncbi:F0F1 ATP synthase subunit gamma [Halodesulfovibrio marinisediminis]|uniref:F-type H+-transporting ATPase subunit gamma n=1 Tax=Halodesulfovibrio marinisediminis DSM 17456 TaxID=1121457 RepID=A0A1N6GW31_9BACT|nr:FoF1 ATP synthase subunit gamma [Halodesulfovibrio marinisediminis]SIO11739.1 F-type H+-transporting ATPase subunit gamma [Halodesulfovibrio marinisediminis DSM 17456]